MEIPSGFGKPKLMVSDALHGAGYRQKHPLSYVQSKAMSAIERCRTARLGAHVDICYNCGDMQISYNSCRNRHCPKCQTLSKERWIEGQSFNLLNVPYFHDVFTLPSELNPITYQNQQVLYNLLFHTIADTLQELAKDKKYLGATLGFTAVLHTLGQNLMFHPHIHCIIPAGGLNTLSKWVPSKKKFFLPVKVISRKFRDKSLYHLKQAKLNFFGAQSHLANSKEFQSLLDICYKKEWIVYCKPPFKDASCVVEYLGRYTYRVAISNHRILGLENGQVSFKWRDYSDSNKWKTMRLSADEFIRRFLMHVLPSGFMKIRHYGLLENRNKNSKLRLCKKLTFTPIQNQQRASTLDLLGKLLGRDICKCPVCGCERNHSNTGLSPPVAD